MNLQMRTHVAYRLISAAHLRPQLRQYLYVCTCTASKLSTQTQTSMQNHLLALFHQRTHSLRTRSLLTLVVAYRPLRRTAECQQVGIRPSVCQHVGIRQSVTAC
jgi:hypothetical protein